MIRLQLALTVMGPPRPWLVVPSDSTSPSTSTFTPVRMISPRPHGEMEVIFDPLVVFVPGSIVRLPTTSLSLSALSVMFPPRFVDEGQDPEDLVGGDDRAYGAPGGRRLHPDVVGGVDFDIAAVTAPAKSASILLPASIRKLPVILILIEEFPTTLRMPPFRMCRVSSRLKVPDLSAVEPEITHSFGGSGGNERASEKRRSHRRRRPRPWASARVRRRQEVGLLLSPLSLCAPPRSIGHFVLTAG